MASESSAPEAVETHGTRNGTVAVIIGGVLAGIAIPVLTTTVLQEEPKQADQDKLVVYGDTNPG